MQGAQILRNEAYIEVRCNDEGCSATQQMDFLRSRQNYYKNKHLTDNPEQKRKFLGIILKNFHNLEFRH